MLQQNRVTDAVSVNGSIVATVLAQQNLISRPFATLFETLQSLSVPGVELPKSTEFIITEATRRFLVALEYVAPGGGLSAWGRAVLVAHSKFPESTLLFVELIRGDAIDAQLDGSGIAVSVADIIERTFTLFESESSSLFEPRARFDIVVGAVITALGNLIRLISCGVFVEIGCVDPLESVLSRLPFQSTLLNGSGAMMRFLCGSSEEQIRSFLGTVRSPGHLRADFEAALKWWEAMTGAIGELKQRSLKPNSRVSSLKNTLVLFECADELIRARAALLTQWLSR
jgi:hypothetical protein